MANFHYRDAGENREGREYLAARDDASENPGEFGAGTGGPAPSAGDLYLSPHSDDICFSLGELAHRRQAGTLLTLYSRSSYVAEPSAQAALSADRVTARRLAEDAAFAGSCGLGVETLDLCDALLRGAQPFALEDLETQVEALEPVLLGRIRDLAGRREREDRTWLFCPCGIGGHVDHVAAMTAVARNLERLQETHRVCFYEDLHYASIVLARSVGLRRLAQSLPRFTLLRRQWPIAGDGRGKLALVRLYASQLAAPPTSIERFSPAIYAGATSHEAVWTVQRRP